jgi:predicted solute-binding protein
MTLLLDAAPIAAMLRLPITEGWIDHPVPFEVRDRLAAADVSRDDIALVSAAEATLLASTHVVLPDVAIVYDGISDIVMRTPVRPDDLEAVPVRLLDTGGTAELLIRALLRPYFGITASTFVRDDTDPEAVNAKVVVIDGLNALNDPEAGFQEDLARSWFILTGARTPGYVVVAGSDALARGIDAERTALREAVALATERRRDIRTAIAGEAGIDRERLAELTNRLRYAFDPEDRQSYANLIARGTWGGPYPRAVPAFADAVESPPDT